MPFSIGPGELIIVLVIALVVLGPGKLPDVASSLGKSLREFRKAATDVNDATRIDAPLTSPTTTPQTPPPPPAPMAAAPAEPAPPADAAAPAGQPARDPNVS
jgi:sec-independent protein translocase protein TatB